MPERPPVDAAGGTLKQRHGAMRAWLMEHALPLWWERGADRARGGFYEAMLHTGEPVEAPRRLRVLTRQIFVYCTAGELGWTGPWREARDHGLDALITRYRRPDGLFRRLVTADGQPADEAPTLYEQAFTLLALSAAHASGAGGGRFAETAREVIGVLDAERRHGTGGFLEIGDNHPFQANAHMHLLEAVQAWETLDPEGPWSAVSDEIAELALDRFLHPENGCLREFFDEAWAPAEGVTGRLVEPGHQFEWAWLLETWGSRRGRADARAAAQRLYQLGLLGCDPARGVLIDQLLDDLSLHAAGARLWPQTEWIKASAILAGGEGLWREEQEAYLAHGARAVAALQLYLDCPVPGLWRDKLKTDGGFVDEPAPASSFYHIIGALHAADRLLRRGA